MSTTYQLCVLCKGCNFRLKQQTEAEIKECFLKQPIKIIESYICQLKNSNCYQTDGCEDCQNKFLKEYELDFKELFNKLGEIK